MGLKSITNKLSQESEINNITSPMTPWQVYELGLMINRVIAKIYQLLAENCIDRKVVYNMLKSNQIEADTLKERISLHLNCEMYDYYGSRGRLTHSIASEVDSNIFSTFDNEVKNFLIRIDHLIETINNKKQKNIPFNSEEVRNFHINIANDIHDFYKAILDLYSQGETKDAIDDIYNLTCNYYN